MKSFDIRLLLDRFQTFQTKFLRNELLLKNPHKVKYFWYCDNLFYYNLILLVKIRADIETSRLAKYAIKFRMSS